MRIALLIDADNISHQFSDKIFDILENLGEIKIAKIFGRANSLRNWNNIAKNRNISIEKHQNEAKNSADFSMTIAGIEILTRYHHLEAFCIVSGDADFIHLISKLNEKQKHVIGMGGSNTAKNLKKQCDKFFDLSQNQSNRPKNNHNDLKQKLNKNTKLVNLIKETINKKSKNNQFVKLQIIAGILGNQPHCLNAKDYGYKSWKDLFYDLDFIHATTDNSNQVLVKIDNKNSKQEPIKKKTKNKPKKEYYETYYSPQQQAYFGLSEWSQIMSDLTGIVQDWDWYDD